MTRDQMEQEDRNRVLARQRRLPRAGDRQQPWFFMAWLLSWFGRW
jgi:hypothetical protein